MSKTYIKHLGDTVTQSESFSQIGTLKRVNSDFDGKDQYRIYYESSEEIKKDSPSLSKLLNAFLKLGTEENRHNWIWYYQNRVSPCRTKLVATFAVEETEDVEDWTVFE